MAEGLIKSVVRVTDPSAVTVIDTSSPKINNIGVKGYPMTKNDSGVTNSTGSSSTVVAKSEGITQASESLLSCANDLSNVLSKLSEVSTSISSNMSGFSQVE